MLCRGEYPRELPFLRRGAASRDEVLVYIGRQRGVECRQKERKAVVAAVMTFWMTQPWLMSMSAEPELAFGSLWRALTSGEGYGTHLRTFAYFFTFGSCLLHVAGTPRSSPGAPSSA